MTPLTPEQRKTLLDQGISEEEIQMIERNRAAASPDEAAARLLPVSAVLGKTKEEATLLCEQMGFWVRVTCEDGHHFIVTRDYHTNRVNLELTAGLVVKAHIG